jgi:hypothetical protein
MAFTDSAKFKGVTDFQKDNLSNNLLLGVQDFFSWGLLEVGGFQNITKDPAVEGSIDGETFQRFRLRPVDDPSYDQGQVWETFRNDLVWETGVSYANADPIQISGVWVDGYYYENNHGTYSHYVDHPNGRVVFDYPVITSRQVEMNFSHRTVGVALASEKFIQELMYDSYDMEDVNTYLISSSGARSQLGERRLQLPVIALELVSSPKRDGYQLGGGQIAYNDILIHIFADNEYEKNNIRDIVLNQSDRNIRLINRGLYKQKKRAGGHDYPHQLDSFGSPVGTGMMYPSLIQPTGIDASQGYTGFGWKSTRFEKMTCSDMEPVNSWLFRSTVRATFSTILGVGDDIGPS